jgi:hypothetical protein
VPSDGSWDRRNVHLVRSGQSKDVSREANGSPTSRKTGRLPSVNGTPPNQSRSVPVQSFSLGSRVQESQETSPNRAFGGSCGIGRPNLDRQSSQSLVLSVGVRGTLGCRQKMTRAGRRSSANQSLPTQRAELAPGSAEENFLSCQTSRSQPQSRPRLTQTMRRVAMYGARGDAVVPRACGRTNPCTARVTNHRQSR